MFKTVKDIYENIASLQNKLKLIQTNCPHPNKQTENKADTGNYDPSDNCYWKEHFCPDCDKKWVENY